MGSAKERWVQQYSDKRSGVAWWDSLAQDFSKHDIPNSESSLTMRLIDREHMVTTGCSVLDVGCGAGRFSVALASKGALVRGTDISPKMIGFADTAAAGLQNVSFSVDDWHTLDLGVKDWEKGFDLVLANMTPAVISAETLLKLSDASRGWCVYVKPSRRSNSILDPLGALVGAPRDTTALDEAIALSFELLWEEGLCPRVDYTPQVWHSKKPLEEAIFQYTKRIESYQALSDSQRQTIREYLSACAVDGLLEETTTTTIVAMYWQV